MYFIERSDWNFCCLIIEEKDSRYSDLAFLLSVYPVFNVPSTKTSGL